MNENTITINGVPVHVDENALLLLLNGLTARSSPLMKDYVTEWYERYKKRLLRPKTMLNYESMLKAHIIPFFGEMRVGDVTTSDIQSFFDTMPGAARSTVKHMKDVLHQIFDAAVEDGYATKNPTNSKRLVLPSKQKTRNALTPEQVQHILFQMVRLRKSDQLLLMLLIFTGMRKGEILGLKWEDIDMKASMINVSRAVVHVNNRPVVGRTKTDSGTRDVPILPQLERFLKNCERTGVYVIGGKDEPVTDTGYSCIWKRISDKIELYGATSSGIRSLQWRLPLSTRRRSRPSQATRTSR